MKKISTTFFQIIIVLVGILALTFLIWEPTAEGVNVGKSLYQIYFNDPFVACAYLVSIAFFVGLYQTFKVFGYARENSLYSPVAVQALRTIKYCAITLVLALAAAEGYLMIVMRGKDDIAGGVAVGLFLILVFTLSGIVASVFERRLQRFI